jgi:Zn-dependent protease
MRPTFKLFNIPVTVGFDFLIIISLLAYTRLSAPLYFVSWLVTASVSILLHELGHAFAFKAFGATPWIRLYSFGGMTGMSAGDRLKPWQELLVSLAGPAAGLALGALCFFIYPLFPASETAAIVFGDLLFINIGWGLMNLLPLYPLDGGRVARVIFTRLFKTRGETALFVFSMTVAAVSAGVSLYYGEYWLAILCGFLFWNNLLAFRQHRTIGKDKELSGELRRIYALLQEGKYEEALKAAEETAAKATMPAVRSQARALSSWALYKLGKPEEALQVLEMIENPKFRDDFLYGILLSAVGRFQEARDPLLYAFKNRPGDDTAGLLFETLKALGDFETLYDALRTQPGAGVSDPAYTAITQWFHENKRYEEAAEISLLQFSKFRTPLAAYNAACSTNRMGDRKAALRLLGKAIAAGFADALQMAGDPDFADLAGDERFRQLLERVRAR